MQRDHAVDPASSSARMAGLLAFNQNRKASSRENLLAAAIKLFCRDGYAEVSIEDITGEAGVSRVTFYRHYASKAAVALELFRHAAADGTPRVLAIGTRDYRNRATVAEWLADCFAADYAMQGILRVLSQANVEEADFSRAVQPYIFDLIGGLGKTIPAFAIDPGRPADARRRVEAWLLLYTILDQSNHAATRSGISADPLMIDVLADTFLDFVNRETDR